MKLITYKGHGQLQQLILSSAVWTGTASPTASASASASGADGGRWLSRIWLSGNRWPPSLAAFWWAPKKSLAEPKTKGRREERSRVCGAGAGGKEQPRNTNWKTAKEKHKQLAAQQKFADIKSVDCSSGRHPPTAAHRWWNKIEYTPGLAAGGWRGGVAGEKGARR